MRTLNTYRAALAQLTPGHLRVDDDGVVVHVTDGHAVAVLDRRRKCGAGPARLLRHALAVGGAT